MPHLSPLSWLFMGIFILFVLTQSLSSTNNSDKQTKSITKTVNNKPWNW